MTESVAQATDGDGLICAASVTQNWPFLNHALIRQRQAALFDSWLLKAASSSLKSLKTFAKGLFDDYAAVKASMSTDWSNGPVEGLNNKLKMLKRHMYGRASLDLLAKRLITPPTVG